MKKFKEDLNETKSNLKLFWKFIRDKKKTLITMVVLTTLLSLISVLMPILSAKLLLNLSNGLLSELFKIAVFIFVFEITRNVVNFLYTRVNINYMQKTMMQIQLEMLEECLKIESSEIDKNTSGIFAERINDNVANILRVYSRIFDYFIDTISDIGVLIAVFIINKWMGIYFIISSLVVFIIDNKRRNIVFKNRNKYRDTHEKRTGLINEIIRGIRDIKVLNASEDILSIADAELKNVSKQKIKTDKIESNFNLVTGSISDFLDVMFFALGIFLMTKNSLKISDFVILYTYKYTVEQLFRIVTRLFDEIKDFNLDATRINEILTDKFKKEIDNGKLIDNINTIEFENITFAYNDDNVLNNVSFKINKGERVGFVGVSGSGKSTIFSLLTRLYKCEKGRILINDKDINNISISSIRNNMTLIPQTPYIFNFSVKDNIKLSNGNASDEEVIECAKKADIYDRIMELDNGFDTHIGEGGVTLSGGERQRIAIERTLLKSSDVILFDEATSSLDNISQNKVQDAIYGLDKNKTILIIAHRLSTIINCDKIIVIDDGNILDIGTHEELLNRCKKYKELYKYEMKK